LLGGKRRGIFFDGIGQIGHGEKKKYALKSNEQGRKGRGLSYHLSEKHVKIKSTIAGRKNGAAMPS